MLECPNNIDQKSELNTIVKSAQLLIWKIWDQS